MEILLEPIQESLMTLPFLFIALLLVEFISSRNIINKVMEYGRVGPVIGAIAGCIPQCGFSVIAARLYTMKIVTVGTLISVFVATSDEAFAILVIHPELYQMFILLIVMKIVMGIVSGSLIDLYNRKTKQDYEYLQIEDCNCGCTEGIFIPALLHTIKIFIFILLTNIGFTLLIEWISEDTLMSILNTNYLLQPLVAGLVGFIPNCAGSVVLTQLFVSGGLSFGALLAGLTTSAGVGTLAIIRYNEDKKDTIKILLMNYIIALIFGYLFTIII